MEIPFKQTYWNLLTYDFKVYFSCSCLVAGDFSLTHLIVTKGVLDGSHRKQKACELDVREVRCPQPPASLSPTFLHCHAYNQHTPA